MCADSEHCRALYLIFIEGFGPVSPASKRLFVELLQRDYLTAPNGVLVLPRREAASLPPVKSSAIQPIHNWLLF